MSSQLNMFPVSPMIAVQADLERLLIKLEERRRTLSRKELEEAILDLKHIIDFVLPKASA